jgi:hypothetical protein
VRRLNRAAMKGILVAGPGDGREAPSTQPQLRRASFQVLPNLLSSRSKKNVLRGASFRVGLLGDVEDTGAEEGPATPRQTPRGNSLFRGGSFRSTAGGASDGNADGGQTAKAAAPVMAGISALYRKHRRCASA